MTAAPYFQSEAQKADWFSKWVMWTQYTTSLYTYFELALSMSNDFSKFILFIA